MSLFKLERYLSILITMIVLTDKVHSDDYTYKNQKNWYKEYVNCGVEMQSPINLVVSNATTYPLIPKLKLHNFEKNLSKPINLRNSGHSIYITTKACNETEIPAIEGGKLPIGKFEFHQIHFHWGEKNEYGSEHTINGKTYSLELHIVFINEKYNSSFKEAIKYPDGIAVIGILFKTMYFPSCCNNKMESLLQNLHLIEKPNSDTNIDDIDITLLDFIGQININNYFTYQGSLTTPPCSTPITWIVFKDILNVSKFTMKQFRKLYNEEAKLILNNYRDVQPIGDRKVYYRFSAI